MAGRLAGHQDVPGPGRARGEPGRARKQEPETILARPPSRTGARAGFRDAPAIRDVVKILSDARRLIQNPCRTQS